MKNQRTSKGNSLISFPDSYTIIDIETTGLSPNHDQIIELSALRIRDNSIIESFSSLVKPVPDSTGMYINEFIETLTGITNDMLSSAPDLFPALQDYLTFLGDDILVGHNVNFDINFLYDNSKKMFSKPLCNDFIDTMKIFCKLYPEYPSHRLEELARKYSINYSGAHRSLTDCQITAECYNSLRNDISSKYESLDAFITHCSQPYRQLRSADIISTVDYVDPSNPLFGKVFVFTGVLDKMKRNDAMQIVVNHGGINGDRVTQKTNYLVLGDNSYCSSIKDGKSSKQKRAEVLKLNGCDIDIIPESVFYDMIPNQESIFMSTDTCISSLSNIISSSIYSDVEKHTMQMLLAKDKEIINYLETETDEKRLQTLHQKATTDNKDLRKLLHLPITKELRYMQKDGSYFSPCKVISFQIVAWYKESNSPSLEITLETNQTIRILCEYFSHMQKPSFERDIHEQEKNIE